MDLPTKSRTSNLKMTNSFLLLCLVALRLAFCYASKPGSSVINIEVVYMEKGVTTSLKDAQIACFDEQPGSNGMALLTETVETSSNGKATLYYSFQKSEDNAKPNIYCKIEKENVFTVRSVRQECCFVNFVGNCTNSLRCFSLRTDCYKNVQGSQSLPSC